MEYRSFELQVLVLCTCVIVFAKFIYHSIFCSPFPADLPRVRDLGKSRFSLKTRLAYYTNCVELFQEAYEKYSKHGKTCIVPGLGLREEVVLPLSALQWATSQPDNVLSVHRAFADIHQAKYNAGSEQYIRDPWQGLLVKFNINRVLETLMIGLADEVGVAFDRYWGINTEEWKEIDLYDTMKLVVAQASGRFTVGVPLCRDKAYIKSSIAFGDYFVLNAGLIGLLPRFVRPVFGRLSTLPNRYHEMRIRKCIKNLFEERVASLGNDPKSETEPQDHFQMMLRYAQKNRPSELRLNVIAGRLAVGNFGAIHQTSVGITNMIFNIIDSEAKHDTTSALRYEMAAILEANNNVWTKASISKMIKTDSVMRETQRINSFGNRSVLRLVTAKDGLKTPDGHVLPYNSPVSFLAYPAHQDSDVFDDPVSFDPFRFSKLREAGIADAVKDSDNTEKMESGEVTKQSSNPNPGNLSFVSTGPANLPFGHGKNACPGRFLVDFELKMILAYMVMNCDVELAPEHNGIRPPSDWIAEAMMPPTKGKIRVKRKIQKG